ncbi:MAG: TolC family protein, partial [Duncaniella sp.]|nr:TolC family protein [Duncaniella sp.]
GYLWGEKPAGNKWNVSVSQGFDWPGVYAARRKAAGHADRASQLLRESALLDARTQARQRLVDVIHLRQLLSMQDSLASLSDRLLDYYKKGVEEGIETRLDYNKTVIERIAVHRELHSYEQQWSELMSQLASFNGGEDLEPILSRAGDTYPARPEAVKAPSASAVRERDPMYAAAAERAEVQKSLVKVEKLSRLPGFSIGYEHETELDGSFNGFSIGISIPSWGKSHKALAARLEAEAAMLDAEMALVAQTSALNAAETKAEKLRHILEEYEPVVNDPSNIKLLALAFKEKQITYPTFIQESNYFVSARRDYIDTLYEYHTLLVTLSRYD